VQNGGRILLLIMLVAVVLAFRRSLAGALGDLAGAEPSTSRPPRRGAAGGADGEAPERFEGLPAMDDQMIEDVREYAAENPHRVAEVIQSWVYEPERHTGR
jgi:flagellar biosynthesis/type III secretory pathway M-ring protein FliF/YscJ